MVKGVGLFVVHACFSRCREAYDRITPSGNMGMDVGRFIVHVCFSSHVGRQKVTKELVRPLKLSCLCFQFSRELGVIWCWSFPSQGNMVILIR